MKRDTNTKEKELEKRLGVIFKNPGMLHRALIHRSYLNESGEPNSNETLEFLGDAVLEFIVSTELFNSYPKLEEGELTALRSQLVNTTALSQVAEELSLGSALYLSRGEEGSGGRKNPSLLADTFEAVIGAIFLDLGVESAQQVVKRLIIPRTQVALHNLKDPKSLLQEIVQAKKGRAPVYGVLEEKGPDHAKVFKVGVYVNSKQVAWGTGKNKQTAQQSAAKNALEKLG